MPINVSAIRGNGAAPQPPNPPSASAGAVNEDNFAVELARSTKEFWSELQRLPIFAETGIATLASAEAEELRKQIFDEADGSGALKDEIDALEDFAKSNKATQIDLKRASDFADTLKGDADAAARVGNKLVSNYENEMLALHDLHQQQRQRLYNVFHPNGALVQFNDASGNPILDTAGNPLSSQNIYDNALRLLDEKQTKAKEVLVNLYNERKRMLQERFDQDAVRAVMMGVENSQRMIMPGNLPQLTAHNLTGDPALQDPSFEHEWVKQNRDNFLNSKTYCRERLRYGENQYRKPLEGVMFSEPQLDGNKNVVGRKYSIIFPPGLSEKGKVEFATNFSRKIVADALLEGNHSYDLKGFYGMGIKTLEKICTEILQRDPAAEFPGLEDAPSIKQLCQDAQAHHQAWRQKIGLCVPKGAFPTIADFSSNNPVYSPAPVAGTATPINGSTGSAPAAATAMPITAASGVTNVTPIIDSTSLAPDAAVTTTSITGDTSGIAVTPIVNDPGTASFSKQPEAISSSTPSQPVQSACGAGSVAELSIDVTRDTPNLITPPPDAMLFNSQHHSIDPSEPTSISGLKITIRNPSSG
jgi:hypothetical protein